MKGRHTGRNAVAVPAFRVASRGRGGTEQERSGGGEPEATGTYCENCHDISVAGRGWVAYTSAAHTRPERDYRTGGCRNSPLATPVIEGRK